MPLYVFICPKCRREFEVSRQSRWADAPVFCLDDGTACERNVDAEALIEQPVAVPWTHFDHEHGSDDAQHEHEF